MIIAAVVFVNAQTVISQIWGTLGSLPGNVRGDGGKWTVLAMWSIAAKQLASDVPGVLVLLHVQCLAVLAVQVEITDVYAEITNACPTQQLSIDS